MSLRSGTDPEDQVAEQTVDGKACASQPGRIAFVPNDNHGGAVAGKFEIYKDKSGKFRFRLKAGNGEIIASGEAYESKAAAKNGVASVQKNAADAAVVDLTE
jgi:uncharacterized protein YegP (UPF0339 family)